MRKDATQNRGIVLLQSGTIDVIALGTNEERESKLHPIKIDISRGIVGFRLLVIRAADQARIRTDGRRRAADSVDFWPQSPVGRLPIMEANGFSVTTSSGYEDLFAMLVAGRFDALPAGA